MRGHILAQIPSPAFKTKVWRLCTVFAKWHAFKIEVLPGIVPWFPRLHVEIPYKGVRLVFAVLHLETTPVGQLLLSIS